MQTKARNLLASLFANYWFLPGTMCLAAGISAVLVLRYDARADATSHRLWQGLIGVNTGEGARQLLSTIASSTMSICGVVFSITVLALSFASRNYGPRLLRNFMRDRRSQVVLGAYVSTYLYALLVLRTVGGDRVPHTAVAVAIMLAVVCLLLLVFFIHHIARSLQVSSIVAAVGRDLDVLVDAFLKERPGYANVGTVSGANKGRSTAVTVTSNEQGYLQALSREDLLEAACAAGGTLALHVRPGDYLLKGTRVADIAPCTIHDSQRIEEKVRAALIVGEERTNEQDLEFPIDQLAEIAVRALSPGTNDPFTAISCINQLAAGIKELARHEWAAPSFASEHTNEAVVLLPMDMERLLHRAFDQTLHYGGSNPAIQRQVMKALAEAAEGARSQHCGALRTYADLVLSLPAVRGPAARDGELAALHERVTA